MIVFGIQNITSYIIDINMHSVFKIYVYYVHKEIILKNITYDLIFFFNDLIYIFGCVFKTINILCYFIVGLFYYTSYIHYLFVNLMLVMSIVLLWNYFINLYI